MKVINISRIDAQNFEKNIDTKYIWFSIENSVWISISEPGDEDSVVKKSVLDSCNNLKLAFWDLESIVFYSDPKTKVQETLHPPSFYDAEQIYLFLLRNKNKNIIVNCAAGVSRSGAIARFCSEYLGYEWVEENKKYAMPNNQLFTSLVRLHTESISV